MHNNLQRLDFCANIFTLNSMDNDGGNSSTSNFVASMFDPSLTWKDIDWLKRYNCMLLYVYSGISLTVFAAALQKCQLS